MKPLRIAIPLGRIPGSTMTKSDARKAGELWLRGLIDLIIASGRWNVMEDGKYLYTEAVTIRDELISMGVPESVIILDDWPTDTVANMVGSFYVLKDLGIQTGSIVIVSIPHANRRALWLGRKFLPNDFTVSIVTSDYDFNRSFREERVFQAKEVILFIATRLSLLFVRHGDMSTAQRRLELWHPGYRKNGGAVHPVKLTTR